jgi:tetratricopeptide (TPR) repeat protein
VPVWQSFYEENQDKNFEIISAAQDTGGEDAAGSIFERADVTYTAIIDVSHTISSLYNFVNVPSAVWIDEEGRIVRYNEGTYAASHKLGTFEFGRDDYLPAVQDWVDNGADSQYVQEPDAVRKNIIARTDDAELAEPTFKLGVYFHQQGDEERANQYWEKAQALNPDSWNFHRQDWSFTPAVAIRNWSQKVQELGDRPYYQPLRLERD